MALPKFKQNVGADTMTRGKRDVLVYVAAIVAGAAISLMNNPLTGVMALLVTVGFYELSYQVPSLRKIAVRRS